mmetsp:Transcript_3902/g.5851  ORF Transcript_3902/g.5851 Transcript_3902/m.5851 type:complete len:93 (-) Transcript_3902:581-859(-)
MTKIVDGVIQRNSDESGEKTDLLNRYNYFFIIGTILLSLLFGLKGFLVAAVGYGMYRLTLSVPTRGSSSMNFKGNGSRVMGVSDLPKPQQSC